jgi:hypothetical protein
VAVAPRVNVGTGSSSAPGWPTGSTIGDLGLLVVNHHNEPIASGAGPEAAGWTLLPNQQASGLTGASTATGIQVYTKRHDGSESAPNIDTGSPSWTRWGVIVAYRNVDDDIAIEGVYGYFAGGSTSWTLPGGQTSTANVRAVFFAINSTQANNSFSGWTNANVSGLAEIYDTGGIGIADGTVVAARNLGTTAVTESVARARIGMTVFLRSADHASTAAVPLVQDDFSGGLATTDVPPGQWDLVGANASINASDQLSIVTTADYGSSTVQVSGTGPLDNGEIGPVQVVSYPTVTAGSREHWFYARGAVGGNQRIGFIQVGNPYALRCLLFNNSSTETSTDVPWVPNTMRWWRVVETDSFLHWQVSPTNGDWITVRVMATPAWLATANFDFVITGAFWGTETAGQLLVLDDIGQVLSAGEAHGSGGTLALEVDITGGGQRGQSGGGTLEEETALAGAGSKGISSGGGIAEELGVGGGGTPSHTGGGTADLEVSERGSGEKGAFGGETVSLELDAAGGGAKAHESGGGAALALGLVGGGGAARAGGEPVADEVGLTAGGTTSRTSGGAVDEESSVIGSGVTGRSGGATIDEEITTVGAGHATGAGIGGGTTDLTIGVVGGGRKSAAGGADVAHETGETGTGSTARADGSTIDLELNESGGGKQSSEAASGGTLDLEMGVSGGGEKNGTGGADAGLEAGADGNGKKEGSGGRTLGLVLVAVEQAVKTSSGWGVIDLELGVEGVGSQFGIPTLLQLGIELQLAIGLEIHEQISLGASILGQLDVDLRIE